ncbi:MAG: hypothetical protein OXU20_28235 [Myxococcales bacterium]|nr:hypothetical protein [Myxococcales bacterium]MDD9965570.1 hypothetical protein [Myxococcales bacterium]
MHAHTHNPLPEERGHSPEPECCCMVLGKAQEEVRLAQIAPDVWSLLTLHGAGNSRFAPRLPNRMLAFRLRDGTGKQCLVLLNTVWPDHETDQPFEAIRTLSRTLDAPVRFVLNPGPEHHLSLAAYARAFPEARVCVAEGRLQRENPALCAMDNVELMAVGDALPELSRQGLHVHVWDGFMEQSLANRAQFRFGARRGTAEPTVFWHEASGIFVNGGHGWFYWAEGDKQPWLIRRLLKPREGAIVWSPVHYSVHDPKRCIASAQRILDWRFEHLVDLHAGADKPIKGRAHEMAEELIRPMLDEDWDSLPFPVEPLEIPEGKVTGGDWKSYR